MATADFLTSTLTVMGLVSNNTKVLDCCAGDGQLAFALSNQFSSVSSNDMDNKTRAQTHYDVRRPDFWQALQGQYDFIITEPPAELIEPIVVQGLDHCQLVALFLTNEKVVQAQHFLAQRPASLIVVVGSQNSWYVWTNSPTNRPFFVEFNDTDVSIRPRMGADEFLAAVKDRVTYALSRPFPAQSPSQFMSANPFYPQSQFQPNPYGAMGFAGGYMDHNSMADPYQQHLAATQAPPYMFKRDPSAATYAANGGALGMTNGAAGGQTNSVMNGHSAESVAIGNNHRRTDASGAGSNPAVAALPTPNGAGAIASGAGLPFGAAEFIGAGAYPGRHPGAGAYNPSLGLPYYRNNQNPPSPPQNWQFQGAAAAAAWTAAAGQPGFPGHVPNPYPAAAAGTQFNPAAILMDMDRLTNPPTAVRSPADAAAAAATSPAATSPYSGGLHKPTAFKPGSNLPPTSTSPGPTAAAVAAAIEDQQLMLSQAEMLYLKGVHAAKQGKALEVAIDKYRTMYSKKDVITKVCKMKYRSAQRKLRIAKHIQRFPEISTMTQRQAERYISEKLRKSRSGDGRVSSPEADED